jgi:hypothetical protein
LIAGLVTLATVVTAYPVATGLESSEYIRSQSVETANNGSATRLHRLGGQHVRDVTDEKL